MRALAAVPALAATVALAAPAAVPPAAIPLDPPLAALDPATGGAVALDPREGPIHVMVMATWCRPCLEQIPRLFDLEDRYKAEGYRLFLVAVPTRQTSARLEKFAAEGPVPGRLLLDETGAIAAALGAATIPAHVLIDRQGRIVARSDAPGPEFAREVDSLVRKEGRGTP